MAAATTWMAVVVVAVGCGAQRVLAPEPAHMADAPAGTDADFLTIEHFPQSEELVFALGPIDLPARTSHHALQQLPVQEGRIPFDMTVDAYRVEAIDRHGERVPQDVIHHFNLLDPTDRELFLPIMRRVLAASHETPPVRVPEILLGVPFEAEDPFLVLTMLHNPTDVSYEGVMVRLVMDYNRSGSTPLYRMYPFHLDVMFPFGSKAFDLPPGRSVKYWDGSPAVAGGIVGMGGHLHPWAERLEFIDLSEGRVIWRYEPSLGPDGHVKKVPVLFPRGRGIGYPIQPSHRYRVQVTYFNPTHDTIVGGGMGSVAGAIIPYHQRDWPAADPQDPMYAEDYAHVITSTRMEMEQDDEGHRHDGESAPNDDRGSAESGDPEHDGAET
jgi:hypothetical protein